MRSYQPSLNQQEIFKNTLLDCMSGSDLVYESLLWRGFLVNRIDGNIYLLNGSHLNDGILLSQIEGLKLKKEIENNDFTNKIIVRERNKISIAKAIIFIPEHRGLSGFGTSSWNKTTWGRYSRMIWGAQKGICPNYTGHDRYCYDALDTGIALLVKVMPLLRIATSASCDGHGVRNAYISFNFKWDFAWAKNLFEYFKFQNLHSSIQWVSKNEEYGIIISPKEENNYFLMFKEINLFARKLINKPLIKELGIIRRSVINDFKQIPTLESFNDAVRFALNSSRKLEKLMLRLSITSR